METQLLSSKEAAIALDLTYDGLSKAIQNGRIKVCRKTGRQNFFNPDDIREYKQRREARYAKL